MSTITIYRNILNIYVLCLLPWKGVRLNTLPALRRPKMKHKGQINVMGFDGIPWAFIS